MTKPRVLLAITVYNGWDFVPRAIESATRISTETAEVDVLILDDCSPQPGFSQKLADLCADLDVGYYRTPRNLGIVRNVNLGLLRGLDAGYDYVIISNSDVVYPANIVDQLVKVHRADPTIGSVTAWSTNVSAYSLPNEDPDAHVSDQAVVDWVSASLAGAFGDAAMDIPAGISFCILISAEAIRSVGVMDTVFGRGYCEETDWSLRSLIAGFRLVLAPGTFVYHAGRGSTVAAGMVSGAHTTVPENEAVIDLRYPLFRHQVRNFLAGGVLQKAHLDAVQRLCQDAGRQYGYTVEIGWAPAVLKDSMLPRVVVVPDGSRPEVSVEFRGFSTPIEVAEDDPAAAIEVFFGGKPAAFSLLDRGRWAERVEVSFSDIPAAARLRNYPSRV